MGPLTDASPEAPKNAFAEEIPARSWGIAAAVGVALGVALTALAESLPAAGPVAVGARPFLVFWSPLTAIAVGLYLHWAAGVKVSRRPVAAAAALAVAAAVSAACAWTRSEAAEILAYLHLPAAAWFATGWWLSGHGAAGGGARESARVEGASYLLKSAEAAATAAVFMAGVALFEVLTSGIFAALDVRIPEELLRRFAVFGAGTVAVLSVASVYRPGRPPSEQDLDSGLMRLLRLLARIFILPAIGVLLVYVAWFIPHAFDRAFRDRDVLVAFHATVFAVLALLVLALPGERERLTARWRLNLRVGLTGLAVLTIALNAYALTAVVSRTFRFGLTPNRHAVIGWGVLTLACLILSVASLMRGTTEDWPQRMRHSPMRVLPAAAVWTLWVVIASLWIG